MRIDQRPIHPHEVRPGDWATHLALGTGPYWVTEVSLDQGWIRLVGPGGTSAPVRIEDYSYTRPTDDPLDERRPA